MQYFSFTTVTVRSFIITAIIVTLASAAFALPQAASAYSTTAQSVTKLTDNTFLFQVTYRLNFLNRETIVPILASRADAVSASSPQLQYSLRNADGERVTAGASTAIVLSDTSVVNNQYFLPEATVGLFTVLAIVQLPDDVVAAGGEAALHIDWLPFTLINDGVSTPSAIPPADLTTYRTPQITW